MYITCISKPYNVLPTTISDSKETSKKKTTGLLTDVRVYVKMCSNHYLFIALKSNTYAYRIRLNKLMNFLSAKVK